MNNRKIFTGTILLVMLTSGFCYPVKLRSQPTGLTAIKITTSFPIIEDGILTSSVDSLLLYYYGNDILYITPYADYIRHITLDRNRNFLSEKDTMLVRYRYFIYNRYRKYGVRGDSVSWQGSRKMMVDSFLNKYGVGSCGIDDDFFRDYILYDSLQAGDEIELKFKRRIPAPGSNFADSAYLYYNNKLLDVGYALSTQRDTIRNRKLYKLRGIHNERYNQKRIMIAPKTEFWIRMEPAYINDPQKIIHFFEQFRVREF